MCEKELQHHNSTLIQKTWIWTGSKWQGHKSRWDQRLRTSLLLFTYLTNTHTHTQDLNTHTSLNRSCKLWRSESRSECLQSTNVPVWKPVSHLHLCPTYSNSGLWATCVTCGPVTTSESSARSFEKLRDSELACNFGTRSDHECNTRLRSSNMKTTVHHCGVWMCSKEGRIMNGLYGLTNTCLFQYFSLQLFTVSCSFIHSYGSVQIL